MGGKWKGEEQEWNEVKKRARERERVLIAGRERELGREGGIGTEGNESLTKKNEGKRSDGARATDAG